jgi:hydroxymethylpyrimidine pyrophosphatase-like HAD family hydrolase
MYDAQLASLPSAFREARRADLAELRAVVLRLRGRQALFVGSGGALAVAELAADLHQRTTGELARAVTPLELDGLLPLRDAGVVMFSASARHPDAHAAIELALAAHADPVAVVTHRMPADMAEVFRRPSVNLVTVPPMLRREGFLATRSVLAMATVATRVYAGEDALPAELLELEDDQVELAERVIVLYAPGARAVAVDLETRLAETGLGQVQLADYRNFAHGRHHGLATAIGTTTVVAFVHEPYVTLADRTLAALPPEATLLRVDAASQWPAAALELLGTSMRLVGATASARALDPARPRVPEFGRRLYHLPAARLAPVIASGPVGRKLAAAGLSDAAEGRTVYERALSDWLSYAHRQEIGGVVLDYDGTVCATELRFHPPGVAVRQELERLLEDDLTVGLATGRGGSAHESLREWLPEHLWSRVELGLYNGAVEIRLDEELAVDGERDPDLTAAAKRLAADSSVAELVAVDERPHQLHVSPRFAEFDPRSFVRLVSEALARPPAIAVKVMASAHSVDVVPLLSAKSRTLERVRKRCGREVLAIGDQGHLGGNDFELLAAHRLSLSVDRCSGDPTRCWNLDGAGERGPELLVHYLAALAPARGVARFRWPVA